MNGLKAVSVDRSSRFFVHMVRQTELVGMNLSGPLLIT